MANCLRLLNLLLIALLVNISKTHKSLAIFETANYSNCIYVYHPIFTNA